MSQIDDNNNEKEVISLGMGDPTAYSCFTTTHLAQDAVLRTLSSSNFNGYAPTQGLPTTRMAIADYLSRDLPYELTMNDVFVTSGCTNAIDIALSILARPGANILVPTPGFPIYELCASFRQLEVRHFNLLPNRAWEVDLDAVESLADENTVAIVIINPGNPCGNVYSYQHLQRVMERLKKYFDIYGGPPTFIQAAVPQILEETDDMFFKKNINLLKQTSELCFEGVNKIPCLSCPQKPDGSMAVMVKLNLALLKDITDDIDFCFKLAKEEFVIILPGVAVGMKDWLRITFAVEPASLEEAIQRISCFCHRHAYQLDTNF
ncbi:unnamed protein product [Amaranthus hypochondriacus]